METFKNILTAILCMAVHGAFSALIINLSNNPQLGWFILLAPYIVIVGTVTYLFITAYREDCAERKAAALMGQPYEKAYANENATRNINAQIKTA